MHFVPDTPDATQFAIVLTIVLILGPIRMEDLGKLKGLSGLGALGDLDKDTKGKDKDKKGGGE